MFATRREERVEVPVRYRLPLLCLKCGTAEAVETRPKTYLTQASLITYLVITAAGGTVAGITMQHRDEPTALVVRGGAIIAAIIAVMVVVQAAFHLGFAKRVEVQAPLCDRCVARAAHALRWSHAGSVGMLAACVVFVAGAMLSSIPLLVTGGLVVVVGLGILAKAPTYLLRTTAVTPEKVSYLLDPNVAARVREAMKAERRS